MNAKWCISTLIIILALLGLSQEQSKASNQQILLKFTDSETASETVHDEVLANITKKLNVLGIDAIEIIDNDETQVSIRYYSDLDVLSVKEFLSQDGELPLSLEDEDVFPFEFPNDQFPDNYSLVVSDLQQQTNDGLSLNGKFAFELRQNYNRYFSPVVIQPNTSILFKSDIVVSVAYKINKIIASAIDNTSQTIPEVRAGPLV